MGWLERADQRNQTRARRDNERDVGLPDAGAGAGAGASEVAGSYASYIPGYVGVAGIVLAAIAARRRHRRAH